MLSLSDDDFATLISRYFIRSIEAIFYANTAQFASPALQGKWFIDKMMRRFRRWLPRFRAGDAFHAGDACSAAIESLPHLTTALSRA